jgi:hypothetical protein
MSIFLFSGFYTLVSSTIFSSFLISIGPPPPKSALISILAFGFTASYSTLSVTGFGGASTCFGTALTFVSLLAS